MAKIKLLVTSIVLMFFINQTKAQNGYAWDQLGSGMNNGDGCKSNEYIQLSKYINGNLYVVSLNQIKPAVNIQKWNGTSWSQLPLITNKAISSYFQVTDLEEFNGELYISGRFDSTSSVKRSSGKPFYILKFNGTDYDSLPSFYNNIKDSSIEVSYMKTYGNKLYYIFNNYYTNSYSSNLVSLDVNGTTSLIKSVNRYNVYNALDVVNNRLVVGGNIDSINNDKTSGMFYYDGTNFYGTKSKMAKPVWKIYKRNSSQYIVLDQLNKLEIWQGDSMFKDISNNAQQHYYYSGMTFYDKFIIPSFNQTSNYIYYDLDSSKWILNNSLTYSWDYKAVNAGPNKAIMASCNIFKGAAELKLGAIVKGKLYADIDSSCTFNSGDIILKNTLIEFDNGTRKNYTTSDKDGNYEISTLAGSYTVTFIHPDINATIAPCTSINITIVAGTTTSNLGIPIHPNLDKNLGVTINGSFRARLGFTEKYYLTGKNYSILNDSLVLNLKYPSNLTYVSSDIAPFSNTGNELIYKFSNVDFLESKMVLIEFKTTVGVNNLNDKLSFFATVLNSTGDIKMSNNFDTLKQIVTGAYDPNIKQSYPEGEITHDLKKIKYIIHFQNTGNDTAYKVTVVDSFTQRLGLRSLRITGTSHPSSYSLRVENPGILIWEFNNILLPDSHINEKASHGHIAFEAEIDGGLAVGDKIDNKAYIYFDYQTPIITNVASVIRVEELSNNSINISNQTELKLYPNPSNGILNIEIENELLNKKFEIYNQFGQLVLSSELNDNLKSLNVSNFSNGFYILKVENTEIAVKFLVMN